MNPKLVVSLLVVAALVGVVSAAPGRSKKGDITLINYAPNCHGGACALPGAHAGGHEAHNALGGHGAHNVAHGQHNVLPHLVTTTTVAGGPIAHALHDSHQQYGQHAAHNHHGHHPHDRHRHSNLHEVAHLYQGSPNPYGHSHGNGYGHPAAYGDYGNVHAQNPQGHSHEDPYARKKKKNGLKSLFHRL